MRWAGGDTCPFFFVRADRETSARQIFHSSCVDAEFLTNYRALCQRASFCLATNRAL